MESISSTYLPQDLRAAGSNENIQPKRGPETSRWGAANSGYQDIPVINVPDQAGFKLLENAFEEFKPYSRNGEQKNIALPAAQMNKDGASSTGSTATKEDPQIQAQIAQLKAIEEKVKAHEAAHKSAGGAMTGPVSYTYTRGPDGRSYITGGEVPISVSPGKTPQETISRMQQVIQAALAPADPSPQDRAVAAQAAAQQQEASLALSSASLPQRQEPKTFVPAQPGKQGDNIGTSAAAFSAVSVRNPSEQSIPISTDKTPQKLSYYA